MIRHGLAALAVCTSCAAVAAPTISGCPALPANNIWNARVDQLPVHSLSSQWIANVAIGGVGATRGFHMDFGSGLYEGAPIGIPYVVVGGAQPRVPLSPILYADESDAGPYPIPPNAPIEGVGPADAVGDRHVLVVDSANCVLYETYNSYPRDGGTRWQVDSAAIFNLNANGPLRPSGWTSADAAGLPIFPGLARYEEVAAGVIEHALRFTAQRTQRAFIWPARHQAGHTFDTNFPPMGARFRLKASYNIDAFSPQARVIAQAMKTYGIMLADNGSPWYVSGVPNAGWDNDVLHQLDVLKGSDFEAVDTASLMVDANSGQASRPSFTLAVTKAGAQAAAGTLTSAAAGIACGATCSASFDSGATVTLTAASSSPGTVAFAGWAGDCSGTGSCVLLMDRPHSVTALFVSVSESLAVSPGTAIPFGGQSMGTSSPSFAVTVSNVGTATRTVNAVTLTGTAFTRTHNCTTVPAGGSCVVNLIFAPPVAAGALNTATPVQETLTVTGDGAAPTTAVTLSGSAEKSLVSHYYRSVLNRPSEAGGKAFWESEASRLAGLGANVNETWFVMANYFFNSPEYVAYGKTNTAFLVDVYTTFFNRPPDQGGFDYWMGQMNAGLSREGVTFWFMFSNEFRAFTQGIFGSTAARPEVDLVMDLFRGILNRFPDTPAFNAFVGQLRTAQCQAPAARTGAVYTAVNDISYFFLFGSAEYANRVRSNTQFVSDMYNAFLRRGGAATEVAFWISQVNTGAKDRNRVRADFIASPEFGSRVNAVINAGCVQ